MINRMNNLFDFDKDFGKVIGTDEAGRGPAAGEFLHPAFISRKLIQYYKKSWKNLMIQKNFPKQ